MTPLPLAKINCVQVVNVQTSRSSSWAERRFFINVGLAFDELCGLAKVPVLEKPKVYECDNRGTRDRLEKLVPNAEADWCVGPSSDATGVTPRLRSAVSDLVGELDRIDGLGRYKDHPWFDRFRPKQENAQVLYLLGDHAGAISEVRQLAKVFHDRRNANRAEWWIERPGLRELQSQSAGDPAAR